MVKKIHCTKIWLSLGLLVLSFQAFADRNNDFEFIIQIPYLYGEDLDFSGGSSASINSDAGFGFAIGYNYSDRLAAHGSFSWNSVSYDAVRVLDNAGQDEIGISGVMDTFNMAFNLDYYLTTGKVAPFITGGLGWGNVDSNIASGPPNTFCWWDPWWGYICGSDVPTYNEDSWFYSVGAGLRIDVGRNTFLRGSYLERWVDIDSADGSPSFATFLFEFGFTY